MASIILPPFVQYSDRRQPGREFSATYGLLLNQDGTCFTAEDYRELLQAVYKLGGGRIRLPTLAEELLLKEPFMRVKSEIPKGLDHFILPEGELTEGELYAFDLSKLNSDEKHLFEGKKTVAHVVLRGIQAIGGSQNAYSARRAYPLGYEPQGVHRYSPNDVNRKTGFIERLNMDGEYIVNFSGKAGPVHLDWDNAVKTGWKPPETFSKMGCRLVIDGSSTEARKIVRELAAEGRLHEEKEPKTLLRIESPSSRRSLIIKGSYAVAEI